MVRTRSGKATMKEETDEDKVVQTKAHPSKNTKPSKSTKAPKTKKPEPLQTPTEPVKSKPDAAAAAHVSFENNVKDQPGKTYIKSPTVKSLKKVFSFPAIKSSRGSALREKIRNSPFFFGASLMAMVILTFTLFTVWAQLSGATNSISQLLFLVLAVHQLDIMANVFNEIVDGQSNSDAAFFFTEAGLNVSEVMLFLYTVHPEGTPSFVAIAFVVGAMFPACWMNVRFRDEDKLWVRSLAYAVLTGCLLMNAMTIIGDKRLFVYASLVTYAMIADLLDLPDAHTSLSWCDGLVMMLRSLGCYFLATHAMLRIGGELWTAQEMQVLRTMGF